MLERDDPLAPLVTSALALFEGIRGLRTQRIHGGMGIYAGATLFAIVGRDGIYLKADGETRAGFETAGSQPYVYKPRPDGRALTLGFWRLPDDCKKDKSAAVSLAEQAIQCAKRSIVAGRRRGPRL